MEVTRENLLELIRTELATQKMSVLRLERESGVPKDTVRDFMRGKTQILRADKMQKIVGVLKPKKNLFITAFLNKNCEILPLPHAEQVAIECPQGFESQNIVAILIDSEAMLPVFYPGWIIYYSETASGESGGQLSHDWQIAYKKQGDAKFAQFIGRPCIIKLADGRSMLRTLKQGSKPDLYDLIAYNGEDIKDAKVAAVTKIVFIRT